MKIVLTGAGGFLGWHTRLRLHALTDHEVVPVTRDSWAHLPQVVADADAVIHIAGVNRGSDGEVQRGNPKLADDVAGAIQAGGRPVRIVYANSIQAELDNIYGRSKAEAADRLRAAAQATGGQLVDVLLPNIFGEHGRPQYNSFVATFVDFVIRGEQPTIADRPVPLLHVQQAAQALIDGLDATAARIDPPAESVSVQEVYDLLLEFAASYATGEFPDLSTPFRIDLFNTYRSALFPGNLPIALTPHADARGRFVETVRCRGGEGQTSFSTTLPDITRGEHYHLSKIERFAVIQGAARISLRKMFSADVIDFDVSGERLMVEREGAISLAAAE